MSKQLKATCHFKDGLLVCHLPNDVVEIELKVKTRWGKHTLIEDLHSRTEKHHPWDRAGRRVRINTRRRRMPQCTDSNNDDPKGNSMDSGTYIPRGRGLDYPSLIFTDPNIAENLTNSDTGDSETERPQADFIGEYCRTCISKWSRCICKTGSDLDENAINNIMQMNGPSHNDQNDKHLLPLDWNNQENFWNGNEYEKSRTHRPRPYRILPKNDSDSDWNENLYPYNYRAKTQSQVSPRQPLPDWPKGIRKESLPTPSCTENDPTPNEDNKKYKK